MACLEQNKMLVDALQTQMHGEKKEKKIESGSKINKYKSDKDKRTDKNDKKFESYLKSVKKTSLSKLDNKRSRDFSSTLHQKRSRSPESKHKFPVMYRSESESPEIIEVPFSQRTSQSVFCHAPTDAPPSKHLRLDSRDRNDSRTMQFQRQVFPSIFTDFQQNFLPIPPNIFNNANFSNLSLGSTSNFPISSAYSTELPNFSGSGPLQNFYSATGRLWKPPFLNSNNKNHWDMARFTEAHKNLPMNFSNQTEGQNNSLATLRNAALLTANKIRQTTTNLIKIQPSLVLDSVPAPNLSKSISSRRERTRFNKQIAEEKEKLEKQKKLELVKKEEKELKALNICFNCGQKNHRQFVCRLSRIDDKKLQEIIKREKERLARTNLIIQQHKNLANNFQINRHCPFIKRLREVAPDGVSIQKKYFRKDKNF